MMSPEEAYKYDHTFRHIVDIMRQELTWYSITPAELRQAAMLAATMHDAQHIRPLTMRFDKIIMDEWKPMDIEYPAMFGGYATGRIPCDKPNFTEQDKKAGLDKDYDLMLKYNCICSYKGSNNDLHSQTCKDYNWDVLHPAVKAKLNEHRHVFYYSGKSQGYNICDCGVSDTYYNYEYNK